MNSEKLDLLKRLQPFLREKMGRAITGDMFCDVDDESIHILADSVCGIPCDENGLLYDCEQLLIVPDVYSRDPERPERGLIGMLNVPPTMTPIYKDAPYEIICWEVEHADICSGEYVVARFGDKSLYVALLKSLCHQEGV